MVELTSAADQNQLTHTTLTDKHFVVTDAIFRNFYKYSELLL